MLPKTTSSGQACVLLAPKMAETSTSPPTHKDKDDKARSPADEAPALEGRALSTESRPATAATGSPGATLDESKLVLVLVLLACVFTWTVRFDIAHEHVVVSSSLLSVDVRNYKLCPAFDRWIFRFHRSVYFDLLLV